MISRIGGADNPLGRSMTVDDKTLQMIVDRIVEEIKPQKIILFGSLARGEANAWSDVDLMIIQETDLPRHRRYANVSRLFWGLGIPMDILVYTPEEFEQFQDVPGSLSYTIAHEGEVVYAAD